MPVPRSPTRHDMFAVCVPGLEAIVAGELRSLGARDPEPGLGGVTFRGGTRLLYESNAHLRAATRVLVRVGSFRAASPEALARGVAGLDLGTWLAPGAPVAVRVRSHRSRLHHTGMVAERVAAALGVERATSHDSAAALLVVRLVEDRATVSVDTSGDPLHRRGWRPETAKAPIRESLAAAGLLAVAWDGTVPLVDPFCGAGTIVVEAATIALGVAPGANRHFAFQQAPGFEPGTWASVAATLHPSPGEGRSRNGQGHSHSQGHSRRAGGAEPVPWLAGRDRDDGAVAVAARNAERAGVADHVELAVASISDLHAPEGTPPGWLVTNPPWGGRVGGTDLRNLYARLGAVVKARLPDWGVAMWVADRRLANHTGLPLRERLRSTSGGVRVQLVVSEPAGGRIRPRSDP